MNILTVVNKRVLVSLLSVFLITATVFCSLSAEEASADTYTNKEKIYLKGITPILYELSEVGKTVTNTAVGLQSEATDKCSYEFGYYQGIVESLRLRLSSIAPPPRMMPVQSTALEAIGDYSTGLKLYAGACTATENRTKAETSENARLKLVSADAKIRKVNELISRPASAPAAAPTSKQTAATVNNKIQQMCASSWPGDQRMQDYCTKNQTEAMGRLNRMVEMYPPGTKERNVMQGCSNVWKKGNTYDYRMTLYCIENQLGKSATP
ncbi:MAG: hypothetical protein RIG61_04820 [Deltaproteobacteria bacterium]